MKRLWQAALEAIAAGIRENDIFFDVTDTSSPYGEATVKNLYTPFGPDQGNVAVNPYYSYEEIFRHVIKPGKIPELTRFLCDLMLHHLWEVDAVSGMDLEEFYVRFLEEDISKGALGTEACLEDFDQKEIRKLAFYYLRLCRTGGYEGCFCDMLRFLFKNSRVNAMEDGSLLVIINEPIRPEKERRVKTLENMFLQAGRICHIYWDQVPGIVECRETPVEGFVLF